MCLKSDKVSVQTVFKWIKLITKLLLVDNYLLNINILTSPASNKNIW